MSLLKKLELLKFDLLYVLTGKCKTRNRINLKMKYIKQLSMSAFIQKSFTPDDIKKSNRYCRS